MTGIITIPTANPGFFDQGELAEVSTSERKIKRKPEIVIPLELQSDSFEIPAASPGFSTTVGPNKLSPIIVSMYVAIWERM